MALKICDPGMGSASFLVSALRYLADALYRSLFYHQWLVPQGDGFGRGPGLPEGEPAWFRECIKDMPATAEHAADFIRARLKRIIVERCLYGVDIDPLAVELGRLSLWIETMDRDLPFGFLDHKLKCGNSLVGCWFDQFAFYPPMAWYREGGDKDHNNYVHHVVDREITTGKRKGQVEKDFGFWTRAIAEFAKTQVKDGLVDMIKGQGTLTAPQALLKKAEEVHAEFARTAAEIHDTQILDTDEQAVRYHQRFAGNPTWAELKARFDAWCALWFWPPDQLDLAPMPDDFLDLQPETLLLVAQIATERRFFHWELEFPDVFAATGGGFDAVLGNPPWDTLEPKSKEFFANFDPLYRSYGKQEALRRQKELFDQSVQTEDAWLRYRAGFKAMSNWMGNVAVPFGDRVTTDRDGKQSHDFSLGGGGGDNFTNSETLHSRWRQTRQSAASFADAAHPFRKQGKGKPYTYMLFLEQGLRLLSVRGRLGFLVPAGMYSDKGATALRTLFLEECRWEWLFGFDNREGVFDIHRSFKFCPVIVAKSGETRAVKTAFMRHDLGDWENADTHVVDYRCDDVVRFSPQTRVFVEFGGGHDLETLCHIAARSAYFSAALSDGALGVLRTSQGDINLTGRVSAVWHAQSSQGAEVEVFYGMGCRNGQLVAYPVYQGAMIHQFNPLYAGYDSGYGHETSWRSLNWESPSPQFWGPCTLFDLCSETDVRLVCRRIVNVTNERSMIATVTPLFPSSDTTLVLHLGQPSLDASLVLSAVLNSFVFDWLVRLRVSGATGATALDFHRLQELPIPAVMLGCVFNRLALYVARLSMAHELFSVQWVTLAALIPVDTGPTQCYARTEHERLRLRCILDAVVAELYGLDIADFAWILRDCDHPVEASTNKKFTRALDPKGFWRVDKAQPPELRHTVLAQVAFQELKKIGLDAFLALNHGDGWMLPETLTLADYGLGHDDRARTPQPVAAALGPRFLDWQLAISPEDSWAACRRHAENIRRIREVGRVEGRGSSDEPNPTAVGAVAEVHEPVADYSATPPGTAGPATDLLGDPVETDLWGNPVAGKGGKRKR